LFAEAIHQDYWHTMLAHNTLSTHDGRLLSAMPSKRPTATNFMFIDSSNGGVNAKPDKIVRSFVMKSARNKKPWSTRPRSPKAERSSDTITRRRPSSGKQNIDQNNIVSETPPRIQRSESSVLGDELSMNSPSSTKSDSIFSHQSFGRPCSSPASSFTSPCMEYRRVEGAFGFHAIQQNFPARYDIFNTVALGSPNSLIVPLDIKEEGLLQQCRCSHSEFTRDTDTVSSH
jgi:hypothetical protein